MFGLSLCLSHVPNRCVHGAGCYEPQHSFVFNVNRAAKLYSNLVALVGLEPTIPKAPDFKSGVYANSTIEPLLGGPHRT